MTNKQAINILLNEKKCIDRNDGVQCNRECGSCDLVMDVETIREAYNMAISALETNVGDVIRRQVAIDAIESCEPGEERFMITSLQSAQPQYTELTPEEAESEIASGNIMSASYWLDLMTRLKQMGYAICRKKG